MSLSLFQRFSTIASTLIGRTCDYSLRGYYTKYDCSAADVNPIGAISKVDLKRFIAWASDAFELPILDEYVLPLLCRRDSFLLASVMKL